jgi:hypothetical protein
VWITRNFGRFDPLGKGLKTPKKEPHQGKLKNIKNKTITNTKERGFNSSIAAPKEIIITNGSSRTLGKRQKNLGPPRRRPSRTQWRGDGKFNSSRAAPREKNNTKSSSKTLERGPRSSRPPRRKQSRTQKKGV